MLQLWKQVNSLINEMRPVLLDAGIPENQITMPKADPIRIKFDSYVRIYDWLHNIYLSEEYAGILKVKKLLPEYVWNNYKAFGVRGLPEQLLLGSAGEKLQKLWRKNRPQFLGRDFKHDDTTDQEIHIGEQPDRRDNEKTNRCGNSRVPTVPRLR